MEVDMTINFQRDIVRPPAIFIIIYDVTYYLRLSGFNCCPEIPEKYMFYNTRITFRVALQNKKS